MAKPELGTKRLCSGCNLKFYDLHKTPVVCPTCDTVFDVPKPVPARPRRAFDPPPAPVQTTATLESADAAVLDDDDSDDKDGDDKDSGDRDSADKKDGDDESAAGVPMLEELDED